MKLISDKEIAKARLLTSGEVKAIVKEAHKFAHGEPDPEAYQLKYLELVGKLSGGKVAQAQLDFSQKEHDAVMREMIKEIEKKMFDIADPRLGIGGILLLREGTFEKAYRRWIAFKKRYVK